MAMLAVTYLEKIGRQATEDTLCQEYASLSAEDIERWIDVAVADEEEREQEDAFLYLALHSYACGMYLPQRVYACLMKKRIYYYGELYMRADEEIAKQMIEAFLAETELEMFNVNHFLRALAMIPCETVKEFLQRYSQVPLSAWAESLYILPRDYVHEGGWTIDETGRIEKLYSGEVTGFEPCALKDNSALTPCESLKEKCGFCSRTLTLLFNSKEKLATCMCCSCYQVIYTKERSGNVEWHNKNELSDFLRKKPNLMERKYGGFDFGLRPSSLPREAISVAHLSVEDIHRTQIGGMMTLVHDAGYPKCPDCDAVMHFSAQMDMEDVIKCGEGIYYFFTCEACGVHACYYDQT